MELTKVKIEQLKPYKNNPRYNEEAVLAVMESFKQVGYVTPIVVDEDYNILAGHTRHQALLFSGVDDVDVVIVPGLTDEQKRKFRLLDNKTQEYAEWDLDKLKIELDGLDFGDFGFWDRELAKMGLNGKESSGESNVSGVTKEDKVVRCPRCGKIVIGMISDEAAGVSDEGN